MPGWMRWTKMKLMPCVACQVSLGGPVRTWATKHSLGRGNTLPHSRALSMRPRPTGTGATTPHDRRLAPRPFQQSLCPCVPGPTEETAAAGTSRGSSRGGGRGNKGRAPPHTPGGRGSPPWCGTRRLSDKVAGACVGRRRGATADTAGWANTEPAAADTRLNMTRLPPWSSSGGCDGATGVTRPSPPHGQPAVPALPRHVPRGTTSKAALNTGTQITSAACRDAPCPGGGEER